MAKLHKDRRTGEVVIASAVTTLPFPPVKTGDVSNWNLDAGVLPIFDFEIWSASTVNLSDAELYGINQIDITIASDNVDVVDFTNNELDIAAHGLSTGDGPIQLTTTGTLPTGLSLNTDYYVIYVAAGTIALAASLEDAIEGTKVTFSDVGSGTHSIAGAASGAYMIRYMNYGFLGPANDGVVQLTAEKGYTTRVNHRPRTVAYAVSATLSAAIAVTATIHPVQES